MRDQLTSGSGRRPWGEHAALGRREPGEQRDETRSRIVLAALQLIADHGFAATSTREISERLGFTKAALYYHFRTKDDLLFAIAEPAITDLVALVDSGSPASTAAERRRIVDGYVTFVATHADLIKVLADDPSVRKSEALRAVAPVYDRLVQILSGTDSPDLVQSVKVRAVLGAVHSALLHTSPGDDMEAVRDTAVAVALTVLGLPPLRKSRSGAAAPSASTIG